MQDPSQRKSLSQMGKDAEDYSVIEAVFKAFEEEAAAFKSPLYAGSAAVLGFVLVVSWLLS